MRHFPHIPVFGTLFAALAAAAVLAGCASTPEQAQQTAYRKDCKITSVDTASKEISRYNADMHKNPAAQSEIEQTEGVARLGSAQNRDRRLLGRGAPNAMDDAQRGC